MKKLYTPKEVAQITGKSVWTIWRWIDEEKVKALNFNGRYLFTQEEVEKIVRENKK